MVEKSWVHRRMREPDGSPRERQGGLMRNRLLLLVLISLLAAALALPAAASAAGNDPYGVYGTALRTTYGASLGQTSVNAPNSYGVMSVSYTHLTLPTIYSV